MKTLIAICVVLQLLTALCLVRVSQHVSCSAAPAVQHKRVMT